MENARLSRACLRSSKSLILASWWAPNLKARFTASAGASSIRPESAKSLGWPIQPKFAPAIASPQSGIASRAEECFGRPANHADASPNMIIDAIAFSGFFVVFGETPFWHRVPAIGNQKMNCLIHFGPPIP